MTSLSEMLLFTDMQLADVSELQEEYYEKFNNSDSSNFPKMLKYLAAFLMSQKKT